MDSSPADSGSSTSSKVAPAAGYMQEVLWCPPAERHNRRDQSRSRDNNRNWDKDKNRGSRRSMDRQSDRPTTNPDKHSPKRPTNIHGDNTHTPTRCANRNNTADRNHGNNR